MELPPDCDIFSVCFLLISDVAAVELGSGVRHSTLVPMKDSILFVQYWPSVQCDWELIEPLEMLRRWAFDLPVLNLRVFLEPGVAFFQTLLDFLVRSAQYFLNFHLVLFFHTLVYFRLPS